MIGILLVVGGAVATGWGIATALRAPRPRCFAGAVVAAFGLVVAMLGATAVAVPGFLW